MALFGVVLVVLAAVLGARRFTETRIEDDQRATLDRTSELVAIAAAENVGRVVGLVEAVASNPEVVAALDGGGTRADFDAIAGRLQAAEGVRVGFVVAPDSTVLGMFPVDETVIGERFTERDWYKGVRRSSPYLSEAYEIAAFDQPQAVTIAATVRRGDRTVGILTSVVETERLGRAIARVDDVGGSPDVAIVDQSDQIVAGSVAAAERGGRLQAERPIPGTEWSVLATVDRDAAFADLRDVRRAATWLMAAVCALLLVLAMILLLNERRLAHGRRALERQAQAFELNDSIVQRLIVAHLALSMGRPDDALAQLDDALESGRRIIGTLADGRESYVRDLAAGHESGDERVGDG